MGVTHEREHATSPRRVASCLARRLSRTSQATRWRRDERLYRYLDAVSSWRDEIETTKRCDADGLNNYSTTGRDHLIQIILHLLIHHYKMDMWIMFIEKKVLFSVRTFSLLNLLFSISLLFLI